MNEALSVHEKAAELKREYARKWRAANKDKVKAINARYWHNRAKKALEQEALNGSN